MWIFLWVRLFPCAFFQNRQENTNFPVCSRKNPQGNWTHIGKRWFPVVVAVLISCRHQERPPGTSRDVHDQTVASFMDASQKTWLSFSTRSRWIRRVGSEGLLSLFPCSPKQRWGNLDCYWSMDILETIPKCWAWAFFYNWEKSLTEEQEPFHNTLH